MHAILFGRKIYALDMPSNFIFTHRRWLPPPPQLLGHPVTASPPNQHPGLPVKASLPLPNQHPGGLIIIAKLQISNSPLD